MKKILLIEDDEVIRNNTTDFLKEEGYTITVSDNGVSGIRLAQQILPDLIICDINMPCMNGYDVLKNLQALPATSCTPFIFLTANSQGKDLRLGMQLGADDYITKPFSFDDLLYSIKTRLQKSERQSEANKKNIHELVENPLIAVFIFSEGTCSFANKKMEALTGYTMDELSRMKLTGLFEPGTELQKITKINDWINGFADNILLKAQLVTKNKKSIPVELYGIRLIISKQIQLIGNIREEGYSASKDLDIPLSERETEVLKLICQGLSSKEIAEKIFLSQRTIDSHRANLLGKTNSRNTAELIYYAIKKGII